jgi:dienelactone hydrolase
VFHRRLEDTAAVARAAIPVERINGPVLLISGREDQVWPSFFMAEQVMGRLRRYSFNQSYRHLAYSGAGHAIGRPYTSTMDVNVQRHRLAKTLLDSGGNPQGTAWAREDSWSKILDFLATYLGVRAPNQN